MSKDDDFFMKAASGILPEFGIGPDAILTRLAAGHNHVFRVDHGADRFVLRLQSEGMSQAARLIQLAWLRAIRSQTHLGVPEPIATVGGAWMGPAKRDTVGKEAMWVLLRWVWGEPLSTPGAFVTPAVLGKIGETIARLHEHSASYRPIHIGEAPSIDAARLVGRDSCLADGTARRWLTSSDYAIFVDAAEKVASAIDTLEGIPGESGLIHGDLAPANWVFHDGEPRIIDFDEFGCGVFLFDLLGVPSTHTMWEDYASFRSCLLDGYTRIRPLAPETIELAGAVQAATLFAWLNHGCRLTDVSARGEFLKWVPPTSAVISRLVG